MVLNRAYKSKAHVWASCSVLALAFTPHIALAACSPNPTQANTTTVCTGVEANGLTVSVNSSSVSIASAASVLAPNAGASAVTVNTSNGPYSYGVPSITTSGTIDGGSQAGVLVTSSPSTYYQSQANITINSDGVIQGAHGVVVSGDSSNYSPSSAAVTNSGLITGSNGAALYAADPATGYFTLVDNLAGGRINGVNARVNSLINAGVIDGGAAPAITESSPLYYWQDQVANSSSGVIRSSGAGATLSLGGWNSNVSNAGVISNTGGGVAIQTAHGLNLNNAGGVVNGDIVAGPSQNYSGSSTVDNTGGVINGAITLGAGSNKVIADFGTAANPIKNISGAIDAGGGTNTLQLNIASDTTFTSQIAAPATFHQVGYSVAGGATLTLAAGSNLTSTVFAGGGGALVNNGNITTTGPGISSAGTNFYSYGLSVTNNGTITANLALSNDYAIVTGVYGLGNVVNTGTVTAIAGGGVSMGNGYTLTNSGTITADNTAVAVFDGVVTNSGVIHSNQGVGFYGSGNVGTPAANTGVIYGQTVGAEIFGYTLTNSGTVSSPGVGVALDPYGSLINQAAGTINGGVGSQLYGYTFNGRIVNFGTINGSVNLGGFPSYYGSNNFFIAQPGSVVNGDLALGSGNDTFVTSLTNTGPGQFAGVTGAVTGGGSENIRYIVTSDATATIATPSLFGSVGYDLSGHAKLTLSATNPPFTTLGFSGTGSVDLTADLTGNGSTSILDLTQTSMQTTGSPATTVPTVLDVTSHGVLTQTHNGLYTYAAPAVRVTGSSSFTNTGTIVAQDLTPATFGQLAAIYASGTVTNTGTISLTSAIGVEGDSSPLTVVNTGTIEQVAGATDSEGIVNAQNVTNTGTISTRGAAVVLGSTYSVGPHFSLTNSGVITSANSMGVTGSVYSPSSVTNLAGGSITGANLGVFVNGSVTNAGTISGGTDSIVFSGYYYGGLNTLTLQTGSTLIGDAVGNPYASNALILQGTGSANNNFVNFNTLDAQGPGTWTLGGTLNIGSTAVSGGTLVVTGALTSSFAINNGASLKGDTNTLLAQGGVLDNGALVFDQGFDASFANPIIGSGALVKQNTGALTVSGFVQTASTEVAGGSLIVAGTLNSAVTIDPGATLLGSTTALQAIGAVIDNGQLTFVAPTPPVVNGEIVVIAGHPALNFTNAIVGSGQLVDQYFGKLTLSGNSSVASTVVMPDARLAITGTLSSAFDILPLGQLVGSTTNLVAQGPIMDAGALVLDQTTDGTLSNAVNGPGVLVKTGVGALTLSGTSTIGATEVVDGPMIVSGSLATTFAVDSGATLQGGTNNLLARGTVTDNGTLVFDQADSGVFANAIVGTGALVKQNAGLLALNGVSTVSTTTVAGGDLQIGDISNPGAQLTSAVTVDAGATLSGHGTIVGSVVNNGGTVAPGGTIGTLTIQGNYTQGANGVLSIEISPTASSTLQVTGVASLGGSLHLVTDGDLFRKGQTYTFVSAGSVTGAFTSVVADNGAQFDVSDPGGVVTATVAKGVFTPSGGSTNQNAIGSAIANYPVGVSDFDPVAAAIIALQPGVSQNAALDQLGGEIHADLLGAGRSSARAVFDSVGGQLFDAGPESSSADDRSGWGRILGGYGSVSGDDGAHGLTQSKGGVVAGGQIKRGAATSLGAALSYQHTDMSLRGLSQNGGFDSLGIAVYGEHRWGAVFVDGAASLAYDHGDSTRHIAFSTVSRRADGGFDGYTAGVWTSLGMRMADTHGLRFEPSISLTLSHVEDGGFQETGAAGADLLVRSQALDSLESVLGARVSKTFLMRRGALTLDARLAGMEELREPRPQATERFAAASMTDFTVMGANPGRSAGLVGAGVTYVASSGLTVFGRYDGGFGSRQSDQVFSLGAKFGW